MKTIKTILITIAMATVILSCSADDEGAVIVPVAVKVNLFEDTGVMENSSPVDLIINFDKPAISNGYIVVRVTSTRERSFQTLPALSGDEMEIPVIKGANSATFKFSPQDNQILEENVIVTFELKESSEGLSFGTKRSTTLRILDNETVVATSFFVPNMVALESHTPGIDVQITLSGPAPGNGTILIGLEGDDNAYHFDSYPAMDAQRKIAISITPGTIQTSFKLIPKNNTVLNNHKTLKLKILETGGILVKGNLTEMNILLLDDEIQGKLKSVETVKDGRKTTKYIEYNSFEKVSRIIIEQEASTGSNKEFIYFYDAEGKLYYIANPNGDEEYFTWTNGKITLSERIGSFMKLGYSTYDYDSNGRIEKKTDFSGNSTGDFIADTRYVYEYYTDGNIKKRTAYSPGDSSNWIQNSSIAFSEYSYTMNPDPLEIIPGFGIQQHLPGLHTITGNGINLSYFYAYEFTDQGKLYKRLSPNETVTYTYY